MLHNIKSHIIEIPAVTTTKQLLDILHGILSPILTEFIDYNSCKINKHEHYIYRQKQHENKDIIWTIINSLPLRNTSDGNKSILLTGSYDANQ